MEILLPILTGMASLIATALSAFIVMFSTSKGRKRVRKLSHLGDIISGENGFGGKNLQDYLKELEEHDKKQDIRMDKMCHQLESIDDKATHIEALEKGQDAIIDRLKEGDREFKKLRTAILTLKVQ